MNLSELSCTGANGKSLHGTAALLHRIFRPDDEYAAYDKDVEIEKYKEIIRNCKYGNFDE